MAELDCMGDFCPVPALKVSQKLAQLKSGELLTIIVDHSCAVDNIRETVKGKVTRFDVAEIANGIWQLEIVKL